SVFARKGVRQEAVGIAPPNAVGAHLDAAVVKEALESGVVVSGVVVMVVSGVVVSGVVVSIIS
ncbi:hypothetical protein QJQ45_020266, partial [Haematococcus lacustris]